MPAARVIAHDEERLLLLDEVEALLRSGTLVVDACRHVVRNAGMVISLATRPVLFALARALGEAWPADVSRDSRSEEHTSELQSLMRISYAVFCLKKKKQTST